MNRSRVKGQVKIQVEGMAKSRHESADSRKPGRAIYRQPWTRDHGLETDVSLSAGISRAGLRGS